MLSIKILLSLEPIPGNWTEFSFRAWSDIARFETKKNALPSFGIDRHNESSNHLHRKIQNHSTEAKQTQYKTIVQLTQYIKKNLGKNAKPEHEGNLFLLFCFLFAPLWKESSSGTGMRIGVTFRTSSVRTKQYKNRRREHLIAKREWPARGTGKLLFLWLKDHYFKRNREKKNWK